MSISTFIRTSSLNRIPPNKIPQLWSKTPKLLNSYTFHKPRVNLRTALVPPKNNPSPKESMNFRLTAFQLALIACICYGLNGPLQKLGLKMGASPQGVSLLYATGIALFAIPRSGKIELFHSPTALLVIVVMGLSGGFALRCISDAFALADGKVSTVALTVACFPLISIIVGKVLFGEDAIKDVRFLIGFMFVAIGLYLAITSKA